MSDRQIIEDFLEEVRRNQPVIASLRAKSGVVPTVVRGLTDYINHNPQRALISFAVKSGEIYLMFSGTQTEQPRVMPDGHVLLLLEHSGNRSAREQLSILIQAVEACGVQVTSVREVEHTEPNDLKFRLPRQLMVEWGLMDKKPACITVH